jgi:hypothetical protein
VPCCYLNVESLLPDGIHTSPAPSCSSRLEQILSMNSLLFKEENEFKSFFHGLLRPFKVRQWAGGAQSAALADTPAALLPARVLLPTGGGLRRPAAPGRPTDPAPSPCPAGCVQHYIPVWRHRVDDVLDALAWAKRHDDLAREIARNAQVRAFFCV